MKFTLDTEGRFSHTGSLDHAAFERVHAEEQLFKHLRRSGSDVELAASRNQLQIVFIQHSRVSSKLLRRSSDSTPLEIAAV